MDMANKDKLNWLKGYKAVKIFEGIPRSYFISSGSRKYIPYKITKARQYCGPLCVFTNEYFAISFAKSNSNSIASISEDIAVYECLYLKSKHISIWDEKEKHRFFADPRNSKPYPMVPFGDLASKVIITKKIFPKEET